MGVPASTNEVALDLFENVLASSTEYSLVATDVDGVITVWNEGARRLYGYSAEQIVGRSMSQLYTSESVGASLPERMMAEAVQHGKWAGSVCRVRQDGSRFTAWVVMTPRSDADREPCGFLLISSDISEEVLATQRLERQRAYAGSLLECAPDAMVIVGSTGLIQLVNAETEKLFGYRREELLGQPVEMLMPGRHQARHPEHRSDFFNAPRARAMGEGLDLWACRKDGSEFPVEISLSPLETDDEPLAMAAIRDVTLRKRAEGKFRGLLESAPDAMVIVNEAGAIQLANAETEKLFGYGRDELIGEQVETLILPRDREGGPEHRAAFFGMPQAGPTGAGLDLRGRRKNGVEFPVEISLSPLETEDGKLATAAIRDVTERRRSEQDLRDANGRLEAASQAKDRFLASMSHELRTPLNAILGFTGMLLMELPGKLNDEQSKHLRIVQSSGKHLLSLINDLLDLARIQAGKFDLHAEALDCVGLLEEVAVGLRPLAAAKGLELVVEGPDGVAIRNDRRAVSQILINLTNNAIKFTDAGAIRLVVSRAADDAGAVIRFSVIDTGRGIRESDQEKLFAAFEQIGSSTAQPYEGTGLGLFISQTLAPMIDGAITFESEFGEGSTFTLTVRSEGVAR